MGGSYQSIEPGIPGAAKNVWEQFAGAGADIARQAKTAYPTQQYQPYPGGNIYQMSPQQQMGLEGIQSWAMMPGATEQAGQNLIASTLGGKFLKEQNPYLKAQSRAMGENMAQGIQAASQDLGDLFSKMGVSYRGPAEKQMRTNALQNYANTMTNLYAQNYGNERQNQMNALNQAQGWAQMPYQRYSSLMQAGGVPQQLSSQQGLFNYNDWLRMIGAQQQGAQMPYNIYGNMLGQMPLMYPQQQYTPGLMDYASQMIPAFAKMFAGGGGV